MSVTASANLKKKISKTQDASKAFCKTRFTFRKAKIIL